MKKNQNRSPDNENPTQWRGKVTKERKAKWHHDEANTQNVGIQNTTEVKFDIQRVEPKGIYVSLMGSPTHAIHSQLVRYLLASRRRKWNQVKLEAREKAKPQDFLRTLPSEAELNRLTYRR